MEYPKISIVTPSYNQAEYLEQTIHSVLDQNYPNLEYVIIDGGSTDGSVDIIKRYADKLTYWVSEKDNGQYDAINKGFSHTTGDIMGWINSSDVLYPWTLHTIAEIFDENKEIKWIHGMPTKLRTGIGPQRVESLSEKNLFDVLGGNYKWLQQESIFWKKELWIKAGGILDTSIKYAGDFNLWLSFFSHVPLYYVKTILGGFRIHEIRRGANSAYSDEVKVLIKKFRSQMPFSYKFKSRIIKIFIGKNKISSVLFRKLGLFPWYYHYNVVYDFNSGKWIIKKK